MSGAAVRQYIEEAIPFAPAPAAGIGAGRIRVARTLLTCGMAAQLLDELHVPEESDIVYRYVNVHNPRCPLAFDRAEVRWICAPDLERHPVSGINWAGAALLCAHLGARLPSAAEWECMASNNDPSRIYPWGSEPPNPTMANYDEHHGGTTPVGSFPPSELGLYDLAGNLDEWCSDRQHAFERVVKGGAWSKDARHLVVAARRGKWERLGTTTIGIRPVWDDR